MHMVGAVSSWVGFKFRIAVMGRSGKFCWRRDGLQMDLGGLGMVRVQWAYS